ncbi:hypothetical protein AB0D86_47265 [Streptomyces sp. NPDC048324]
MAKALDELERGQDVTVRISIALEEGWIDDPRNRLRRFIEQM